MENMFWMTLDGGVAVGEETEAVYVTTAAGDGVVLSMAVGRGVIFRVTSGIASDGMASVKTTLRSG